MAKQRLSDRGACNVDRDANGDLVWPRIDCPCHYRIQRQVDNRERPRLTKWKMDPRTESANNNTSVDAGNALRPRRLGAGT